jgi:hypothetical protein
MSTATEEKTDEEDSQKSILDQKWMEAVKFKESCCQAAEREYVDLKDRTQRAKKMLDLCVADLRKTVVDGSSGQMELDFGSDELDDESWKAFPIEQAISLTEKQKEKLDAIGVSTVGEFEKLRAGTVGHPRGLIDVKGVGQATIDRWEDEILDWFDKREKAKQKSLDSVSETEYEDDDD